MRCQDYYEESGWGMGPVEKVLRQLIGKEKQMEEIKEVNEMESEKVAEEQPGIEEAITSDTMLLDPYDPKEAKDMKVVTGPFDNLERPKQELKTPEEVFVEKLGAEVKKPVDMPFKTFYEELNERFAEFNLSRNSYGEAAVHVKLDILMYLLIKKNVINFEELVGVINSDNKRAGGIIETFAREAKEYEFSIR